MKLHMNTDRNVGQLAGVQISPSCSSTWPSGRLLAWTNTKSRSPTILPEDCAKGKGFRLNPEESRKHYLLGQSKSLGGPSKDRRGPLPALRLLFSVKRSKLVGIIYT